MKKLFTFVALMTIAINAQSQTLTATLQQGDVITPFYGATAFKEAYEAASSGAIITLSAGQFDSRDIEKSITVYGSGAYGDDDQITYVPIIRVKTGNVRIEGIRIQDYFDSYGDETNNLVIRHCYINRMNFSDNPTNTMIDQCNIDQANCGGTGSIYKNCTMRYLNGNNNALKPVTFINSTVFHGYYGSHLNNNIFRNCVIGIEDDSKKLESPGQYYSNIFFRSAPEEGVKVDYVMTITYADGCVHSDNTVDTFNNLFQGKTDLSLFPNTNKKGDDNTKVGPEGGSGYKLYPAIPRIISKSIDRQTDAQGKINVNIQVKAQ